MNQSEVGGITSTEVCNISCVMCHFNGPDALRKQGTLTTEDVRKFVSSVPRGPLSFSSTGEFFMDPNALEHLRIAVEYGHEPRILTNGLLLTTEVIDEILKIGVRHITISVDAYEPDQYRKIRRGGELATIVEACLYLRAQKHRYPDVHVEINNVLFKKTFPLQDKFIEFWRGKVDVVNFNAEYYDTFKFRNTLYERGERVDCQMRTFLLPNGQLSPCCAMIVHQHTNNLEWLPHIRDTSPDEALDTFKKLYADSSSPLGRLCQQCDWWILFKQNERGESPYLRCVPLDSSDHDEQAPDLVSTADLLEVPGLLRIEDAQACNGAEVAGEISITPTGPGTPIRIVTSPERWSYAAAFPLHLDDPAAPAGSSLVIRVDANLESGRIGIGIVNTTLNTFVTKEEELLQSGPRTIEIALASSSAGQWLIVRNTDVGVSKVRVQAIRTFAVDAAGPLAPPPESTSFIPVEALRQRT